MILLITLLSIGLINCKEFSWGECATKATDPHLRITDYVLSPHPVIYPGNVSLSFKLDILKDLPGHNIKVSLNATKTSPKLKTIGCIFGFGSCSYDYNEFWEMVNSATPNTDNPKSPLKTGSYYYDKIAITLPSKGIIKWFKSFLIGDYVIEFSFYDEVSKHVCGCSQFNATMQLDPTFRWLPNGLLVKE